MERFFAFGLALILVLCQGMAAADTPGVGAPPVSRGPRPAVVSAVPSVVSLSASPDRTSPPSPEPGIVGAGDSDCRDCFVCVEPCGPPGRFWVQAEYLLWWLKDNPVPPLATVGPVAGLGVPGTPGTAVILGGEPVDQGTFSGGRFTVGGWFDCCQTCGFEAGYFFLGQSGDDSRVGCPPNAVLARPFFNVNIGAPDWQLACFPGALDGSIRATVNSRLQGAEANAIKNVCCGPCYRFDLLGGFRFLRLDESLTVHENVEVLADPDPDVVGTRFRLWDDFGTRNQFYGGQLGGRLEVRRGRLFMNLLGKVALGSTHKTVDINGSTTIQAPGGPAERFRGGLLALPSNIGHYNRDCFAVVPEVGVNVGYQITSSLRGYVGYTFLYWSDVARPGDQVNLRLNPDQFPPAPIIPGAAPRPRFDSTDFHAHGVNFGLEFRF